MNEPLTPPIDCESEKATDQFGNLAWAVTRLRARLEVGDQRDVLERCEEVEVCLSKCGRPRLIEAGIMIETLAVIQDSVELGICQRDRPLLLCVVAAIEQQIELCVSNL